MSTERTRNREKTPTLPLNTAKLVLQKATYKLSSIFTHKNTNDRVVVLLWSKFLIGENELHQLLACANDFAEFGKNFALLLKESVRLPEILDTLLEEDHPDIKNYQQHLQGFLKPIVKSTLGESNNLCSVDPTENSSLIGVTCSGSNNIKVADTVLQTVEPGTHEFYVSRKRFIIAVTMVSFIILTLSAVIVHLSLKLSTNSELVCDAIKQTSFDDEEVKRKQIPQLPTSIYDASPSQISNEIVVKSPQELKSRETEITNSNTKTLIFEILAPDDWEQEKFVSVKNIQHVVLRGFISYRIIEIIILHMRLKNFEIFCDKACLSNECPSPVGTSKIATKTKDLNALTLYSQINASD
ncbi:unnamed protein product [Orchesella dallaii]|uniref:Uncharacterized protein n=1 Tax=Orchesella dallaii TaxID=48710 RepID=A0ABP1PQ98_9HEXA